MPRNLELVRCAHCRGTVFVVERCQCGKQVCTLCSARYHLPGAERRRLFVAEIKASKKPVKRGYDPYWTDIPEAIRE